MNIKKIICLLLVLLLFIIAPLSVSAETRNIYVGDIISLQIESREFSPEELTEKFRDFEIVEIKDEPGGYKISMRTFETGEYKIILGDKEIIINVKSTLDDIEREDLFEGRKRVAKPGFSFYWRVLFYISSSVFILSGGFILTKILIKRKIKAQPPLRLFLQRSGLLSPEDDNYFVDLTFYFKEYIGSLYNCKIIGKTSVEIIKELKKIKALENDMLREIYIWLIKCDKLKFSGVDVSAEEKREHYNSLIDLAEKIDINNTDKQKEEI